MDSSLRPIWREIVRQAQNSFYASSGVPASIEEGLSLKAAAAGLQRVSGDGAPLVAPLA